MRPVGFWACAALVFGNVVGTGIFTSLGFQVGPLPSPFVILCVWGVGGVVALCGALCYAELAAAMPRSGGEYRFLEAIYGPSLGFAAGFVSLAAGFAAPIALSSMALAEYAALPVVPRRAVAFCVLLAIAAAHAVTVRWSGAFQVGATAFKLALLCAFLAAGFALGNPAEVSFAPRAGDAALVLSPAFAVALLFVLYAYSGWNAAVYVAGEVASPQRVLPRALLAATLAVALLYLSLNALFLRAAPLADFAGRIEVGEIAATALLGPAGGRAMAVLIAIGLVASISAMTWAGPRVTQAMGQDIALFRGLARTSPEGVPRRALALQTAIAAFYLATGTFESVLVFAQFALVLCSFLTVLGLIVLRLRLPALPRPFRCWGYPLPPLLFLALTGFMMAYAVVARPIESVAGGLLLLVGAVVHRALLARR